MYNRNLVELPNLDPANKNVLVWDPNNRVLPLGPLLGSWGGLGKSYKFGVFLVHSGVTNSMVFISKWVICLVQFRYFWKVALCTHYSWTAHQLQVGTSVGRCHDLVWFQIRDQFWVSQPKLHGTRYLIFSVEPKNGLVWPAFFVFCIFVSVYFI